MQIKSLEITNFRGLENISFKKLSRINVVVGPNAIGKTTILESIRLSKALLAQRYNSEAQQTLINMGALSPHNPAIGGPGMDLASLANDPSKEIKISYKLELSSAELAVIQQSVSRLALIRLEMQMVRSEQQTVLNFTQFLSTTEGQARLASATADVTKLVSHVTSSPEIEISLNINPTTGVIRGMNPDHEMFLILLDRSTAPNRSIFNYFPADRALPSGDTPLQLGANDIQQQLLSYIATPALKYARFKQNVIQTILLNSDGRDELMANFATIFDGMLRGKQIAQIRYNEFGVMKVIVADQSTGKMFDIDSMSSGEKGLVLTLLLVIQQSVPGSIVLLDEPELHLNSAVQSKILPFIINECANKLDIQVFICTHSPEIVRDAYENESCSLFHLRAANDASPIYYQDTREVFEIFSRLGSSPAEALFTSGAILVEGDDDVTVFKAGYPDIISGYNITPLNGRADVPKEFARLQSEEKTNKLNRLHLFIFDHDRKPLTLTDSSLVRHKQLQRYAIENYLLDDDILYDLLRVYSAKPPESRGLFPNELRDIAMEQLTPFIIKTIYSPLEPPNAGLRLSDIKGATFTVAADNLGARVVAIADRTKDLDISTWKRNFIAACEAKRTEIESEWGAKWKELASGKLIFAEIYKRYSPRCPDRDLKRYVIEAMREKQTDDWAALAHLLKSGLS